jgi:septum formation protein
VRDGEQLRASDLPRLILASRSPQRLAILERLGVSFVVCPTDVDELEQGDPAEVALENAMRKALAARELRAAQDPSSEELVLGVDTLVALEGSIYGKPRDEHHARRTLEALSGARHEVLSGLALLGPGEAQRTALARTTVSFRMLGDGLLDWYLEKREWQGRAGGYAIQGAGAALVREVRGDYENVVGLPVACLLEICPELLPG